MGRRLLVVVSLAFCLAGLPSHASASSRSEAQFVSLINQARSERGRSTLVARGDLAALARRHSRRMAADGTIYHNRNLSNEIPGNWRAAGENVGMGPDVETLHEAFMSSPGHKANIIDNEFNQVGIGIAVRDGTIYVTEVFVGRTMSRRRPQPRAAPVVTEVAQRPRPAKKRPAPRVAAPPRTMAMLLRLVGLDAERIDTRTGRALGL